MKERRYIPGFDWARLFGSMLVVLAHTSLNKLASVLVTPEVYAVLGEVVPMFFMMAGFLMYQSITTKEQPFRYMIGYIKRYALIYWAIVFVYYLNSYWGVYEQTHVFHLKSFVADVVLQPFYWPVFIQLWFIPPLLVGIFVNYFIYSRQAERKWFWLIAAYALVAMAWYIYGGYIADIPVIQMLLSWKPFVMVDYFLFRSAWGVLYVYIGMWIAKNRDAADGVRLSAAALVAMAVMAADLYLMSAWGNSITGVLTFNLSSCIFATLLFLAILRIKGESLKKYRAYVSLFGGLNYFLHVPQMYYLRRWTANGVIQFLIIIAVNALLTAAIVHMKDRKKGKVSHRR